MSEMTTSETYECARWFRQGVVDKMGQEEAHRFPPGTHWSIESAYEAGVTLGAQMLCEKKGHEDRVSQCIVSTSSDHSHYEDRICRWCDRLQRTAVASFDNWQDLHAYENDLHKRKKALESKDRNRWFKGILS